MYDYSAQIERLTDDPSLIKDEWITAEGLFQACGDSFETPRVGCLTMIRGGEYVAATPVLTERIRADERLPAKPDDITPAHLPVFKEWQEELDRTIRASK